MTTKSYDPNFDGYWHELSINGLPARSGIYGVYACVYNEGAGTVTLNRLIYIGESDNVKGRVANHEKWLEWRRQLRAGEELFFNTALILSAADRERAEAAMINKHKPVCNTEYVNNFPFDTTTVNTFGKNALMAKSFTVYGYGSILLTGSY